MTKAKKNSQRPDPVQRIDSAFFWLACERSELVVQQCRNCGRLSHPPRAICPDCHSQDQGEIKLSGKGTILSWARQVRPASFGFAESPYVILVELEEGIRLVSNFVGGGVPDFGQAVIVDFETTSGGKAVPVFKAAS